MIALLTIATWLMVGLVAGWALRLDRSAPRDRHKWMRLGMLVCTLGMLLLYLRPEEEIEIGEDPGVYFNAASAIVAMHAFHFTDPGLARIAPAERHLFRYGDAHFMHTKDNALWSAEETTAEVGHRFLAGYPLLLALPMLLGVPYLALWVTPLLAILCVWVLFRVVANLALGRGAAWLAVSLYALNPVMVWNARCLRAEIPAALLVLSALLLWQRQADADPPTVRSGEAWLAGLALSLATLFHVTALYVLLPALVWAIWQSRRARFWYAWWLGVSMGLGLLIVHLQVVSDPYWILENLLPPGRRGWFLLACLGGIGGLRLIRWLYHLRGGVPDGWGEQCKRYGFGLYALGFLGLVLYTLLARSPDGRIPGLPGWTAGYISLTDFATVSRMLSPLVVLLGVAGLFPLVMRHGRAGDYGRHLFWCLAPAAVTIGWTNNFMFETRRMVAFLLPLLVGGIVAVSWGICVLGRQVLAWRGGLRPGCSARWCHVGTAIVLLLAGYQGRAHLYWTWNYAGAYGFYRQIADDVRREGDMLFAEYTQTAAPIERLSGVPLLPIAWGYRSEAQYRQIEAVYSRWVRSHPEEQVLFLTPFAGAALPGLALEPVRHYRLDTRRVNRSARSVPSGVHALRRDILLYRVRPAVTNHADHVYSRYMDGSLLGLEGAANFMHGRTVTLTGVPLARDYRVAPAPAGVRSSFHIFSRPGPDGTFHLDGAGCEGAHLSYHGPWAILRIDQPAASTIVVSAELPFALLEVFQVDGEGGVQRGRLDGRQPVTLADVDSQWLRSQSRMALPDLGGKDEARFLLMLASAGREDGVAPQIEIRGPHDYLQSFHAETGWHWYLLPYNMGTGSGVFEWYDLAVSPGWNPCYRGYPADLGVKIALVVVD